MENLLTEYFKFSNKKDIKQTPEIKIIDELNPNKILKKNLHKYIDMNLYAKKNKIDDELYNTQFNIDYDLYDKIINSDEFAKYIKSDILKYKVIEFINEFMNSNKLPIVAQFNDIIYKLYKTYKIEDESDNEILFESILKQDHGLFLYNIITENKFLNILDIGYIYGSSKLFIGLALKNLELYKHNTSYTSIISDEKINKKNIWEENIKKIGYDKLKIINQINYLALPELVKEHSNNKFDLIFIDGWNTFNYTFLEFFYANLLLKVGGCIVMNNANFENFKELNKNIKNNYEFHKKNNHEIHNASLDNVKFNDIKHFDKHIEQHFRFYKKEADENEIWMIYKKIKD
jgi:predicted O-methyltransferase YrrM